MSEGREAKESIAGIKYQPVAKAASQSRTCLRRSSIPPSPPSSGSPKAAADWRWASRLSGIGRWPAALAFAEAGAKVVITGRREKEGRDVVGEITKTGGTAAFVRADVAKDADVKKAIDFVLSTHGRLDVAFNNAGVEIGGRSIK